MMTSKKKMFKAYLYKRTTEEKQLKEYERLYNSLKPVVAWLSSKDNASWADTEDINNFIKVYRSLDLEPIIPE